MIMSGSTSCIILEINKSVQLLLHSIIVQLDFIIRGGDYQLHPDYHHEHLKGRKQNLSKMIYLYGSCQEHVQLEIQPSWALKLAVETERKHRGLRVLELVTQNYILHIINFLFKAIIQLPIIFNNQQTQDKYIYLQGKRKKYKTKVVLSAWNSSYLVKDSETIIISQLYSFTNILGSLLRTAKLPTYTTHLCVPKLCSVHVKLFNIATM